MTDEARDDTDCACQRNLSAAGRRQARAIGRAFRALRIPVAAVLVSAYCRHARRGAACVRARAAQRRSALAAGRSTASATCLRATSATSRSSSASAS
jgi:phosphohistidine phosphatase SixA